MKPRWSATEDAQLMTLAPRMKHAALSARLGRSPKAVMQRLYLLRRAGRISPSCNAWRIGITDAQREIWALGRLSDAARYRMHIGGATQ